MLSINFFPFKYSTKSKNIVSPESFVFKNIKEIEKTKIITVSYIAIKNIKAKEDINSEYNTCFA